MNNKSKKRLNYFGFAIVCLIIFATFLLLFVEPHNFNDYQLSEFEEEEKGSMAINLSDTDIVQRFVTNWQKSVQWDSSNSLKNQEITLQQYQEIDALFGKSISEYNYFTIDITNDHTITEDANRSLYNSLWYITKARLLTQHHPVQNCIDSSLETMCKYNKFFFYLKYDYQDKGGEFEVDRQQFNYFVENYYERIPDNNDKIILRVNMYRDYQDRLDNAYLKCCNFRKNVEDDYSYQNNLFKLKITFSIIVLIFAFVAGKFVTWDNLKAVGRVVNKLITITADIFSEFHTEKKVTPKTVQEILKLGSLTTTLVTITVLIITVLRLNHIVIVGTTVVCVVLLLSSILIGIISINRESEKAYSGELRRWSYISFLVGLILFIVIIIELITIIGLSVILNTTGESIRYFLTNATIVT